MRKSVIYVALIVLLISTHGNALSGLETESFLQNKESQPLEEGIISEEKGPFPEFVIEDENESLLDEESQPGKVIQGGDIQTTEDVLKESENKEKNQEIIIDKDMTSEEKSPEENEKMEILNEGGEDIITDSPLSKEDNEIFLLNEDEEILLMDTGSSVENLKWTWQVNTGEKKCFEVSRSTTGANESLKVNRGDETLTMNALTSTNTTTVASANSLCHIYTGAGEYEVNISNPEILHYLYLYGKKVKSFDGGNGINLYELNLSENQIPPTKTMFKGLTNLNTLKWQFAQITHLEEGMFDGLSKLITLNISNNQFTKLEKDWFTGLTNLRDLYLSYNQISNLETTMFDGITNLALLSITNNQLRTLPTGIFNSLTKLTNLGLASNCLEQSQIASGTRNWLSSKGRTSKVTTSQQVCLGVTYSPSVETYNPVTANLTLYGDMTKKSEIFAIYPNLFGTGIVFTGNGSQLFDVSGINSPQKEYILNFPSTNKVEANVNRIFSRENPNALKWTWQANAGEAKCFEASKSSSAEASSFRTNWGDGSVESKSITYVDLSYGNTICHTYTTAGEYEVALYNPTLLYAINLLSKKVKSFQGGNAINLRYLNLNQNQLSSLSAGAFDSLTNLTTLYLEYNQLSSLPEAIFNNLSKLTNLDLWNNCLEQSQIASGTLNRLISKNQVYQVTIFQQVCLGPVTYSPSTETYDPVFAKVTLYGDSTKKSNLYSAYPGSFSHIFFSNGTGQFDLSVLNSTYKGYILKLPQNEKLETEVTWILSGGFSDQKDKMKWTWQANAGETKCMNISKSENDLLQVNWGDGTIEAKNISSSYSEYGDSICHVYSTTGDYETMIYNPKVLYSINISFKKIKSFQGGNAINLKYLNLSQNQLSSLSEGVFDSLTNLTTLSLNSNQLSSLLEGVFDNLTNLTTLFLSSNQLSSLPEGAFDCLTNLITLNLSNNQLSALPGGIFDNLTNLTTLSLSWNRLNSLSEEILENLSKLTNLDLKGNQLSSLSAVAFDSLTNLITLYLEYNQLSSMPTGVFNNLVNLKELNLSSNQLTSLPEEVFDNLTSLITLNLSNNKLSVVSGGVFDNLTNLTTLSLNWNRLSSLSEGIFNDLTTLTNLDVTSNCLEQSQVASGTLNWLSSKGRTSKVTTSQQVCLGSISYSPSIETSGRVVATLTLYGDTTKKNILVTTYPQIFEKIFASNGTGVFNLGGLSITHRGYILNMPANNKKEAYVSWINPTSLENLKWTWQVNAGEKKCFEVSRSTTGTNESLKVNRGDETLTMNALTSTNTTTVASANSLCHIYTGGGEYEVNISNPEILHYLYLYGKKVKSFDGGNGINLYELNLSENQIPPTKTMFKGLTNLNTLKWQFAQITHLEEGIFAGLSKLITLNISNNQFTKLEKDWFTGLTNLRDLYLSYNQIDSLSGDIFQGLPKLGLLGISNNLLRSLPEGIFNNLINLTTLNLTSNCLEQSQVASGTRDWLVAKGWTSRVTTTQQICLGPVNYTPSTETLGPVVAGLTLYGDAAKKSLLKSTYPNIFDQSLVFTINGTGSFSISGLNTTHKGYILNFPSNETKEAEVTWILDNCPLGDYSGDRFDGICGTKPVDPIIPITPSPSNGGGAGGRMLKIDSCPKGDYSQSYYDGACGKKPESHNSAENTDQSQLPKSEKTEYEKAFDRAYENALTSMPNVERARLEDPITRAEAAKLISIFALKTEKKEADTSKKACKEFNDLQGINDELKNYIMLSCQFGIMGYYANGEDIKPNFDPYQTLTRAEFGTMLSRLLRGNQYAGEEGHRYQSHLEALKEKKIMNYITTPQQKETRGNVFIMLERASQ